MKITSGLKLTIDSLAKVIALEFQIVVEEKFD
jgi:hypothetical protein